MSKRRINIEDINAQSLAGGHILINILNKKKVNEFLDKKLGKRAPRAEYSFSDAIYSWFVTKCRGVKSFESLGQVKNELRENPRFKKGMSPDTLFYICKELSQPDIFLPKEELTKSKYKDHQINHIDRLNELLVEFCLFMGIINTREKYIIDYDTTIIESRNKDARSWYNGNGRGAYSPAVALINKMPIFIENRNGDTNPQYRIVENLKKIVELCRKYGIKIDLIRIDAAGGDGEFTDYASANGIRYITKPKSTTVNKSIHYINTWREIRIKNETLSVGDTSISFGRKQQRLIVNFQDGSAIHNGVHSKWGLLTNIEDLSPKEIINIYRQRGTSEQLFSNLNQVGWKYMRMHKFQHNTVYLYITGLNTVIHRYLTRVLSSKLKGINENVEFDTFRSIIMLIPVMWLEGRLLIISKIADFKGLSGFT